MAIANYSELQTAVSRWLNRGDLNDIIPDFISLGEARLNRDLDLRVMETETALTLPIGQTSVALPAGFLSPIQLWWSDAIGKRPLRYIASGQVWPVTSTGDIYDWTITAGNIDFPRPCNEVGSLVLRYRKAFALSDAEPTNWLLTNAPDAYLAASVLEAGPYLRDDGLFAVWEARYQRAIDDVNTKEARSKSLGTLTTTFGRMPSHERDYYDNGGYGRVG